MPALHTPCGNCPFRVDIPGYIRPSRGEEIWDALLQGGMFPCHKTVDYDLAERLDPEGECSGMGITPDSAFCAGAMILMEREWADDGGAARNQWVRWMPRLGHELDLDNLDMNAAVAESVEDWLEHLRKGNH